jgi:hypothetical protein
MSFNPIQTSPYGSINQQQQLSRVLPTASFQPQFQIPTQQISQPQFQVPTQQISQPLAQRMLFFKYLFSYLFK